MNKFESNNENQGVFKVSIRKDYGEIKSIDINIRFVKEFIQAKLYVDMGIPTSGNVEIDEHNRKLWVENVKPFFDHMSEVLDTL